MKCEEDCIHFRICPVVNEMGGLLQKFQGFWHKPAIKVAGAQGKEVKQVHPIVKRAQEFLISNCAERLSPHMLKKDGKQ